MDLEHEIIKTFPEFDLITGWRGGKKTVEFIPGYYHEICRFKNGRNIYNMSTTKCLDSICIDIFFIISKNIIFLFEDLNGKMLKKPTINMFHDIAIYVISKLSGFQQTFVEFTGENLREIISFIDNDLDLDYFSFIANKSLLREFYSGWLEWKFSKGVSKEERDWYLNKSCPMNYSFTNELNKKIRADVFKFAHY